MYTRGLTPCSCSVQAPSEVTKNGDEKISVEKTLTVRIVGLVKYTMNGIHALC